MTLYDELGIPKDAAPEEVKRAYRKAAKEHHPDAGGKPEKFNQIAVAYRVLGDEAKRAKYDATGETDDQPDQRQAAAMQLVARICNELFADPEAIYKDLPAEGVRACAQMRHDAKAHKAKVEKDIARLRKMHLRWKSKNPANPIGDMLAHQIKGHERAVAQVELDLTVFDAAEQVFRDSTFERDQRPQPPFGQSQRLWDTQTSIFNTWRNT